MVTTESIGVNEFVDIPVYSRESIGKLRVKIAPNNRFLVAYHPVAKSSQKVGTNNNPQVDAGKFDDTRCAVPFEHRKVVIDCVVRDIAAENVSSTWHTTETARLKKPDLSKPKIKKFTAHGRQMLLAAAGALIKDGFVPQDFYFFTGTIPGSTVGVAKAFSTQTRYALNRLKQYLRDNGFELTFNVWEWQKRQKTGRALLPLMLHLHLVIVDEGCSSFPISELGQRLHDKWLDILDDISEITGVNLYERHEKIGGGFHHRNSQAVTDNCTKTVQCEKDPSAYLSKYMGKGCLAGDADFIRLHEEKNILFPPSSWWSISKHLRALVNKHSCIFSLTIPSALKDVILDNLSDFLNLISVDDITRKPSEPDPLYGSYQYQMAFCPPDIYFQCIEAMRETIEIIQSTFTITPVNASLVGYGSRRFRCTPEDVQNHNKFTDEQIHRYYLEDLPLLEKQTFDDLTSKATPYVSTKFLTK